MNAIPEADPVRKVQVAKPERGKKMFDHGWILTNGI
jgi:hypothetical protein